MTGCTCTGSLMRLIGQALLSSGRRTDCRKYSTERAQGGVRHRLFITLREEYRFGARLKHRALTRNTAEDLSREIQGLDAHALAHERHARCAKLAGERTDASDRDEFAGRPRPLPA